MDVIVVTSPSPADGKTTVTTLLGEALGRLGMRVLLIDADLRRPGFARVIGVAPRPGLAEVLRGETSVLAAAQSGWSENVSVLATAHDPEAGDLLARRFTDVIDEAKESFDLILVDTPPLLSTDDARTMATMAKGILLVVVAGNAPAVDDRGRDRDRGASGAADGHRREPLQRVVRPVLLLARRRQQLLVERGERGSRRAQVVKSLGTLAGRTALAGRPCRISQPIVDRLRQARRRPPAARPLPTRRRAPPARRRRRSPRRCARWPSPRASRSTCLPSGRETATTSAAASQSATSARFPTRRTRCPRAAPKRLLVGAVPDEHELRLRHACEDRRPGFQQDVLTLLPRKPSDADDRGPLVEPEPSRARLRAADRSSRGRLRPRLEVDAVRDHAEVPGDAVLLSSSPLGLADADDRGPPTCRAPLPEQGPRSNRAAAPPRMTRHAAGRPSPVDRGSRAVRRALPSRSAGGRAQAARARRSGRAGPCPGASLAPVRDSPSTRHASRRPPRSARPGRRRRDWRPPRASLAAPGRRRRPRCTWRRRRRWAVRRGGW